MSQDTKPDMWGISSAGRALAWHARGQRFDPAILHQKSTVLRRKYGAFLFVEADFWGCIALPAPFSGFCRRFLYTPQRLTLHRFPKTPRTPPTVERFLGVLHFMLFDDPASCSAAAHSHCFSTSFSLFRSSGLAICSFMPVFLASCTSSAKAFAVMAMMGTLPRLPGRERIAAVAS